MAACRTVRKGCRWIIAAVLKRQAVAAPHKNRAAQFGSHSPPGLPDPCKTEPIPHMSLNGRGCARNQLERPAAIFARPGRQSGAVEMDDAPAGMMSRAGVFVSACQQRAIMSRKPKPPVGWGELNVALNGLVREGVIQSYRPGSRGRRPPWRLRSIAGRSGRSREAGPRLAAERLRRGIGPHAGDLISDVWSG
jgi:hypothetical protein